MPDVSFLTYFDTKHDLYRDYLQVKNGQPNAVVRLLVHNFTAKFELATVRY